MEWISILIGLFGGGFGGASIAWILSRKKREVDLDKDRLGVIYSLSGIYTDMVSQTKTFITEQKEQIDRITFDYKENKKEIDRCKEDIKLINKDNRELHKEINDLRKKNTVLMERIYELEKDNNRKAQENKELRLRLQGFMTSAQGQ